MLVVMMVLLLTMQLKNACEQINVLMAKLNNKLVVLKHAQVIINSIKIHASISAQLAFNLMDLVDV